MSPTFEAKLQDYLFFRRLKADLEGMASEVTVVDPLAELPDLSGCDVVFLDFYLEGPAGGSERAEAIAREIANRNDSGCGQQVILMSNREGVADERRAFRRKSDLTWASFAFVPKSELSSSWMAYCHLAVLERARPLAPRIEAYQNALAAAVRKGAEEFLDLIQELDIDDYAHLQSVALMKDGDPLGEYIATLFASELTSRTIESSDARAAERDLDRSEFMTKPFATSEPSTIVKSLFHSALISSDVGELSDHPRAEPEGPYAGLPLVRMGDLFFTKEKDRAICIVSADCDLAFAPNPERAPVPDRSILLVAGATQRITEAAEVLGMVTEGLVEKDEVYKINWDFAAYRSVKLGELRDFLAGQGFDLERRDRLRAPFSFELQQSFGANLFRVGTPAMPPITRETTARAQLIHRGVTVEEEEFDEPLVRLRWHKEEMHVRLMLPHVEKLRGLCMRRLELLEEERDSVRDSIGNLGEKKRKGAEDRLAGLEEQCEQVKAKLNDVAFWGQVHDDHPIATNLRPFPGIGKLVMGNDWERNLGHTIVLHVDYPKG